MKKSLYALLALLVLLMTVLCSCDGAAPSNGKANFTTGVITINVVTDATTETTTTTTTEISMIATTGTATTTAQKITTTVTTAPTSQVIPTVSTPKSIEKKPPELEMYRPLYYGVPAPIVNLVDRDTYFEWELARIETGEYQKECIAVSFVKYFNISKKNFAKANEQLRIEWAASECKPEENAAFEVYDVDLIYSFDNEKINKFFLWEYWPYDSWC